MIKENLIKLISFDFYRLSLSIKKFEYISRISGHENLMLAYFSFKYSKILWNSINKETDKVPIFQVKRYEWDGKQLTRTGVIMQT